MVVVHIPWMVYAQCHCKTTLVICLLLSHTVPSSADTLCDQLANFQDIVSLLTNRRVTWLVLSMETRSAMLTFPFSYLQLFVDKCVTESMGV
jgi:hypothetical protein